MSEIHNDEWTDADTPSRGLSAGLVHASTPRRATIPTNPPEWVHADVHALARTYHYSIRETATRLLMLACIMQSAGLVSPDLLQSCLVRDLSLDRGAFDVW